MCINFLYCFEETETNIVFVIKIEKCCKVYEDSIQIKAKKRNSICSRYLFSSKQYWQVKMGEKIGIRKQLL